MVKFLSDKNNSVGMDFRGGKILINVILTKIYITQ